MEQTMNFLKRNHRYFGLFGIFGIYGFFGQPQAFALFGLFALFATPTPQPDDDKICFKSDNLGWIITGVVLLALLMFTTGYVIGGKLSERQYEKAMRMQDERAVETPTGTNDQEIDS